jgi:hypothetical protein
MEEESTAQARRKGEKSKKKAQHSTGSDAILL